jgi:hypothetical protein
LLLKAAHRLFRLAVLFSIGAKSPSGTTDCFTSHSLAAFQVATGPDYQTNSIQPRTKRQFQKNRINRAADAAAGSAL